MLLEVSGVLLEVSGVLLEVLREDLQGGGIREYLSHPAPEGVLLGLRGVPDHPCTCSTAREGVLWGLA